VADLQDQFDDFVERISLGTAQWQRINSAFVSLRTFLANNYDVLPSAISAQGSCANGTAVKPLPEGDYDLDMILVIPDGDVSSSTALNTLQATLERSGNYAGRVEAKKPCVRLRYADDQIGGFHIDITPARPSASGDAPLDAPRRDDGWHGTAPAQYTAWCKANGEDFERLVKQLKRWRDDHQDVRQAIKSIVLQVLVAACMPKGQMSDARRVSLTFTNLQVALTQHAQPPTVWNPALPSENLAKAWTQTSYNNFKQELAKAQALAERALASSDQPEAAAAWREVFGEDFPLPPKEAAGIRLGDISHARRPESNGWVERLDPQYSIAVTATVYAEDSRRVIQRNYADNGVLLQAGWRANLVAGREHRRTCSQRGRSAWDLLPCQNAQRCRFV
jgi:hypothetical protein